MIKIDRIQARMDELGLNPYAAAKKAGLGPDYVRDLLRGKVKQPSAARLRDLAIALDCSPDFLMGDDDQLGEAPATWRSDSPSPAKLSVEFRIREGYFERRSAFIPHDHDSFWVISAIKDGDEWLERVESLPEPKVAVMSQGTLLHVVAPAHFYKGLTDMFVVETERDDGKLVSRTIRRTRGRSVDDYTFAGTFMTGALTFDALVEGVPGYGKIVGAVIRSYQFYDGGTAIDDF
jgi:transcriptional regulator with XRE-family HTH domain